MEQKYLNTKEAAQHFSVTRATILNWEKRGLIACLKIGKTRRFSLADIEAFERENRTGHE